jgi:hypothetical protein
MMLVRILVSVMLIGLAKFKCKLKKSTVLRIANLLRQTVGCFVLIKKTCIIC